MTITKKTDGTALEIALEGRLDTMTAPELEEELTRVDETDYIEQQAREQLHMIKPGEILYLLPAHDDKE